jgi:hypothetical protein
MKNTILLGALILMAAVTHAGAFILGRMDAKPGLNLIDSSACDLKTGTTVDQRNAVWRVWNDDDSGPDSPEKFVGAALGMMLHPNALPQTRDQGFTMMANKSGAFFSPDEIADIKKQLTQGTPQERADAVLRIVSADADGAALAKAVLSDKARVQAFISDQMIELEK